MSTTKIWCPYAGEEMDSAACNAEHIIPLSLGGSNSFTVPVSKTLNAEVGSAIDAALATRDVITMFRRREFDARGHSNKKPEVRIRNATYGADLRPAQVTLGGKDGTTVWDARNRLDVPEQELAGQGIQLKFTIKPFDRIRFVAKVALAAGYAIYGELFRTFADHADLRGLVHAKSLDAAKQVLVASNLRGCFDLYPVEPKDARQVQLEKVMCEAVSGSVVMSTPTNESVIFTVGVLGQWVGTMNVPAQTDSYPNDGIHDVGHVILMVDGKTERISLREFAKYVYGLQTGQTGDERAQNDPA